MDLRGAVKVLLFAGVLLIGPALILRMAHGTDDRPTILPLFLLVNFIFCTDLADLFIRLYFIGKAQTTYERIASPVFHSDNGSIQQPRRYAVIVSVYNAEREIDSFLDSIEPLRHRLWVVDDCSTDGTFQKLLDSGVRCIRGEVNRKKPGALRELLRMLPPDVETIIVIDPDARLINASGGRRDVLDRVIADFQRSGMAALCPHLVVTGHGLLARLQRLEYHFAFSLGRKSLGDHCITSGIAVYRRSALEYVYQRHSLSVYGEDLRNALILLAHGERIYYDERLVVEMDALSRVRSWVAQRVGWYFSLLTVYREHFSDSLRVAAGSAVFSYHFLIYMGLLSILLHPLRMIAVVLLVMSLCNGLEYLVGIDVVPNSRFTQPRYFLGAYLTYTLLTLIALLVAGKRPRLSEFIAVPVYFIYSVLHVFPITLGYANWISLRLFGHRLNRDRYS